MTLQIHAVTEISSSDLRRLVVDNLVALLGEGAMLVENMPHIDGCCVAISDRHDGPVLLSFDAVDSRRALLGGLGWSDAVSARLSSTHSIAGACSCSTSWVDSVQRTMPRQLAAYPGAVR